MPQDNMHWTCQPLMWQRVPIIFLAHNNLKDEKCKDFKVEVQSLLNVAWLNFENKNNNDEVRKKKK